MTSGELPTAAADTLEDLSPQGKQAFGAFAEACCHANSAGTYLDLYMKAAWLHLQELWDYAGIEK